MSKALSDVVVVDLTTEFWASLGAAMLGDFGARVVRIEELPEPNRPLGRGDERHPAASWDALHELANRNKQSLALNLGVAAGREIFRRLIGAADVFVTDRPTPVLRENGWDYAALSGVRADLVYAHATGFGPKGPDRDLPPLDELAAARTGMMPILPQPGQPPVFPGSGQMYTAVMLAFGVVMALHHRQATGEGQQVDVSLLAGNMYGASLDVQAFLAMGGERFLHPVSRLDAGNPMSGTMYPSSDGRWVTLTMPDTDRWWPAFAEIVGIDRDDPRFDSHAKRCDENRLELMQVLEAAFRRQPGDHWRACFNERQLSADVIEDYAYPASDEQASRNRYVLELAHPHLGAIKTLGFPIFMSDSPAQLCGMAPCVGQHSGEVLHETLGYSADEIDRLRMDGTIA
jgi:formyl-CoA transferase